MSLEQLTSQNLKGRKIALIGGAGFIGHNLALELKRLGAEVTVIDGLMVNNLLYLYQTNVDIINRDMYLGVINERLRLLKEHDIPLYVEDARNYLKLSMLLGKLKPDSIVLLAAVSHAGRSNKDPYSTFDHSLRTLENALDYARSGSVDHFVYFSSSMVYGDFEEGKVTEASHCEPKGIYGALKFGGEKLVIAYNQVFGFPYTIIRPSALYGERCISRRVAQIFIENALSGEPIRVNGNGEDRLDFTYIGDLVHGVVQVLTEEKAKNEIFNLTYGEGRSLAELLDVVKKEVPDVEVEYLPRDELMPERGTLSVEKARNMIGYNPSNPLDVAVPKYVEWYRSIWDRAGVPTGL